MEAITNAQDVAAIWFTVFFLAVIVIPAYAKLLRTIWNLGRTK
jgi:hypothetical protein